VRQVRLTEDETNAVVSAYLRERTDLGVSLPHAPRVEDIAEALHLTPAEVLHLLETVRQEKADAVAQEEQEAEAQLRRVQREAELAEAEARIAAAKAEKAKAEAATRAASHVIIPRDLQLHAVDVVTPEEAARRIRESERIKEYRQRESVICTTILIVIVVILFGAIAAWLR
jgi:hypothetical protein